MSPSLLRLYDDNGFGSMLHWGAHLGDIAMTMAFFRPNELDTTTMIKVDAVNTLTIANAFDRDKNTRWVTVGYGTTTSTIFSIEFPSSTSLDKCFLINHNLKQFRVFYNSTTANTFTPNISETTNSATSNYYSFATTAVSSVQIQVDRATTADTEKAIGEIYFGSLMLTFERNPNAASYKPLVDRQQVVHKMPNGGVTQFIVANKFKAQISWKFLTESFYTSLLNIYETGTAVMFVPFGTTTSWDGKAYECLWTNDFDFKHSTSNQDAGYGGQINLEEVA